MDRMNISAIMKQIDLEFSCSAIFATKAWTTSMLFLMMTRDAVLILTGKCMG